MGKSERKYILESQFHWGDRSVVLQLWNIAFCFNNDLFLHRLYIGQCKWFREWSIVSYRWWPMESYREPRQFPVKKCLSPALCRGRMVKMTVGDTGESSVGHFNTLPFPSCCPYVAVSHFQFLYLVCVCVGVCAYVYLLKLYRRKKGNSCVGCFFFHRN